MTGASGSLSPLWDRSYVTGWAPSFKISRIRLFRQGLEKGSQPHRSQDDQSLRGEPANIEPFLPFRIPHHAPLKAARLPHHDLNHAGLAAFVVKGREGDLLAGFQKIHEAPGNIPEPGPSRRGRRPNGGDGRPRSPRPSG